MPETPAIHQISAEGRWYTFPLCVQMANIGSEFSRAKRAFDSQNSARFESALSRMLELYMLTLNNPKLTSSQRREICRSKEYVLAIFFGSPTFESKAELAEADFLHYGIAARR